MKKAILYSALALATTLGMSSCGDDFLKIDPTGAVSEGTLTNDQGIDFVLTGAYSSLNGMFSNAWSHPGNSIANPIIGDVMGGDAYKGSDTTDQPDWLALEIYSFNGSNPYIKDKWTAVYEAVKRANLIISMVNKGGAAISNADQIIGQALFLKAIWMFEGIKCFGAAIPYVSVEDYEANVDPQVSNVDESGNYVYIWDKVEADLKEAISKLPATWPAGEQGRATSWMAKALLGKVYLFWSSPYNGNNGSNPAKLADAKAMLEDVLNNGVDAKGQKYTLAENYDDLYRLATSDWTGESIIDIQLTIDGNNILTQAVYGGFYTGFRATYTAPLGQGWGFYQPSYNYVNSMIVDANGLPLADFDNYASVKPLSSFDGTNLKTDLSVAVDPRLDYSATRAGVPFLDWGIDLQPNWIRNIQDGGPYQSKKEQPGLTEIAIPNSYSVSSVKNFHILRLADVKLMLAEIAIRQGDLETARTQINDIRKRAANSCLMADYNEFEYNNKTYVVTKGNYTFDDKVNGKTVTGTAGNYRIGLYPAFASEADAWTALKRERRAELSFEGMRFFDLCRWGEVGSVLGKYVDTEHYFFTKFTVKPANFAMLPLPTDELNTAAGRFVQNADWK